MSIESLNNDIKAIDKAIKIIEKTENYLRFNKAALIFALCDEVNKLRELRDKQNIFINSIN